MTCKFCGAELHDAECLPTEDGGRYFFECGTVLDTENGVEWEQSLGKKRLNRVDMPTDTDKIKAVAAMLGRRGGKARARGMTDKQLSEAARKAAVARWRKRRKAKR